MTYCLLNAYGDKHANVIYMQCTLYIKWKLLTYSSHVVE
jgi:hypothetical protein